MVMSIEEDTLMKPFKSDGCSFVGPIYKLFGKEAPGTEFCVAHDIEFWMGGTFQQFVLSNLRLATQLAKAGYPILGLVRLVGVFIGGWPFLPFPWRWGFGHNYRDSWWFKNVQGNG